MAKQQRIGILFGPFDPVSRALIRAGQDFMDRGEADLLLLMPIADSAEAVAEDRWKMLVAACACDERLVPSRFLLDSHEPAPSSVSVKKLRKEYPCACFAIMAAGQPDASAAEARVSLASGVLSELLDYPVREYCRCKGLYGFPGRINRIDPWMEKLFSALKPKRYAHSLSVAWTAVHLAELYGLDVQRAEQAGLLHDCAKCLPLKDMQKLAAEHSLTEDETILANPGLLHSLAGAWIAQHEYGMTDPQVLDAIACHNTGRAGMTRLSMCVCLADSIEPLRRSFPLLDHVRALAEQSLEKALLASLEGTASYVSSHNCFLHPQTQETIRWLKSLPETQD